MRRGRQSAIYRITNLINGKIYIGSALYFKSRRASHWNKLDAGIHHNKHLQNAWNKYGRENFVIEIIEKIDRDENEGTEIFKKRLLAREQYYLDTLLFAVNNDKRFFQLGYNKARMAGSSLGCKIGEIGRKNISEAHKGIKPSEETRRKMSIAHSGKKLSVKTKRRMSRAFKGINAKPILQYTLGQKLIKRWNSITDAKETLKINGISDVLRKKNGRKTAGNFYWKYENEQL